MNQTCKICNKEFYSLRAHLKKHKITWQEYLSQYGEKPAGFELPNIPDIQKLLDSYHVNAVRRAKERVRKC